MPNPNYILVPIDLCFYTIQNRFSSPFQLYIHLKGICDGKLKLNKSDIKQIAIVLGVKSDKTVLNNLKLLLKRNWVGYNKKSGYYFVRGFNALMIQEGFKRRTAAEFDSHNIQKFKAFIAGAVIGYMIQGQKRKRWRDRTAIRASQSSLSTKSSIYSPVAAEALAKILGISRATASRLKNAARKGGFIKVRRNYQRVPISAREASFFKKACPEIAHKMCYRSKGIWEQLPDNVLCLIRFKSRKKVRTLY